MKSKSPKPRLAITNVIVFALLTVTALVVVPAYGILFSYSGWDWLFFGVLMTLSGMSITAGYHRLWSHRTYKAAWPVRLCYAVIGALALQNSVLNWAARHRVHHRHVDDVERDPHSIKRGFWHAHMGWMLRHWPTTQADYDQVPDLKRDPIVMWQHKYYWALTWTMNLGLPVALGWAFGNVWSMVLLAGVFRLVLSHHLTFFINSLAHTWGRQNYSDDNTARDSSIVALLTWGEGYHNYHHAFQGDYRNGVRWWHFDPSKWLVSVLSVVGLTWDIRRTPKFKIHRARLQMQFRRLQAGMAGEVTPTWRETLEREYQQFRETVSQWQAIQSERVQAGREALRDRWERTRLRTQLKELEYRLKMQRRRLAMLIAAVA